jgi:hypothetical protein
LPIERWPSRVKIYVSARIPVLALPYEVDGSAFYALVDSSMFVVNTVAESDLAGGRYAVVNQGISGGIVTKGTILSGFGDLVIQLQNVAVSFQYAGLSANGFSVFIREIDISSDGSKMNLVTNEGIVLVIDLSESGEVLTTETLRARVESVYSWYLANRDNYSGGYAIYDKTQQIYKWYSA